MTERERDGGMTERERDGGMEGMRQSHERHVSPLKPFPALPLKPEVVCVKRGFAARGAHGH